MYFQFLRKALFLFFLVLLSAPPASNAQQSDDPIENARFQFGPLGLTPSISLANLGIDSNVFNEFDNPRRDFTFTLAPQLNSWFRAGRSRLSAQTRADLIYFHTYSSERSVDGDIDARWQMPMNRLTPWVGGGYSEGRQRLGYEIDLRSRRVTNELALGVDARITRKTGIGFSARRMSYSFDADEFFRGTSLQEVLNRTSESVGIEYRQSLTPLTTFVVQADALRDRFGYSLARNSDSVQVQVGFDLQPFALISGRARVGYRKFDAIGGGYPSFRGVVANFTVASTVKGRTRIELSGDRDVNYSFEVTEPYYVQTGAVLTATPRLTDHWDIQVRGGGQRLAYRAARDRSLAAERVDRSILFGGGVGYTLGRSIRVGVNVDRQRRRSPLFARAYEGYRIGTSVAYGR